MRAENSRDREEVVKAATERHETMQQRTRLLAATAVAAILALTGCTATPAGPSGSHSFSSVPQSTPTSVSPTGPLAEEITKNVLVSVYPGTAFRAKHGCECSLKDDSHEELFPAGTTVMLVKITLTGTWGPSQGAETTQDVTGLTLTGTKFEGRPENAVIDTKDGPSAADRLHLPWQASGLFGTGAWTITNNEPVGFAVAWYVPAGVSQLHLVVTIPSEGRPTNLFVDIPAQVLALTTRNTR
jgi:hypothetical protein